MKALLPQKLRKHDRISQIPMGIAGPLRINGLKLRKICSFRLRRLRAHGSLGNRGCKAISLSGGANVNSFKVGVTRGPVFYTGSIEKSNKLFY